MTASGARTTRVNNLPLSGVTVVSMEQAIAAPLTSRHLADWGARVIKIERPGGGDFCRDYDHVMNGMSSQFVWTNRSKESLVLDVKTDAGRSTLDTLLAKADVFVQNLAPDAAERLGVQARAVVERFPRMIACAISGYGSSGPYSRKKAYDLLVQVESGFVSINGSPDAPAKCGLSIADIATGMYALQGILMGLYRRERTGQGMAFEVSLFDALTEWMSYPVYYTEGSGTPLPRGGLRHATIAPYGPFTAGDGRTIFFGIQNEREWRTFCAEVLNDEPLHSDPRFASNTARVGNREALQAIIDATFASWTSDEVLDRLDRASIANARMNSVTDLLRHPQLQARNRTCQVGSPAGPLVTLLPAITIDGVEPVMRPVPGLGEHSAQILADLGPAMAEPRDPTAAE
jgi:crotonobetainyl-CoA:carnitine CoA-transferase CaiB-like acyl-CoA transferase